MKKILMGLALGVPLSLASVESFADAAAYTGWYAGAGLGYQYTKADAVFDDNMRELGGAFRSVQHEKLADSHPGKVGGSLVGGYGDYITGSCYLGGELTLDIAGNKTKDQKVVRNNMTYSNVSIKTNGFVPTLAVRLGGYIPQIDALVYLRGGLTFTNTEIKANLINNEKVKCRSVTPIIGLGIEKDVYDRFTVRLEGDYRFASNKSKTNMNGHYADGSLMPDNYRISIKNKSRSYAIRLLAVYHF